jgi:flagellar motility protein MotE (MotC chaperone)
MSQIRTSKIKKQQNGVLVAFAESTRILPVFIMSSCLFVLIRVSHLSNDMGESYFFQEAFAAKLKQADPKPKFSKEGRIPAPKDPLTMNEDEARVLLDLADGQKILKEREHNDIEQNVARQIIEEKFHSEQKSAMNVLGELKKTFKQYNTLKEGNFQEIIKKLAKVYDGMMPAQAAKILNDLPMETLIPLMRVMEPKKLSGIMGSMDPARAQEVTTLLSEVPLEQNVETPQDGASGG